MRLSVPRPVPAIAAAVLGVCSAAAQSNGIQTATPQLPTVNLGLTSFLDGMAAPGWAVEEYGQGVHDQRTIAADGTREQTAPTLNTGSGVTHLVWVSQRKVLGAWYGAEVLVPVAYVDAKSAGQQGGVGDITLAPLLLQWPEHKVFGKPIYQRVLADFEAPTGEYSDKSGALNIGANHWTVHPYYAFTLLPASRWETSWRVSYLWNSVNRDPIGGSPGETTQAGQALHFNATLSYALSKNLYVGANGYFLHQLTDHQVDGKAQAGTQVVGALGPGLVYHRGSWFFYGNAYLEFAATDMSEGNKLVLRVTKTF